MKKLIPLLLLTSTCLVSCGKTSFTGRYKFMLGRQGDNETRVCIEMNLKDEAYEKVEGAKKFDARFELSGISGNDSSNDIVDAVKEVISILFENDEEQEEGVFQIPGYYTVSDLVDERYGNKVAIAFDLDMINDLIQESGFTAEELVSSFLVSYCNGKTYTFQIPVSLDDIQYQLAWYGIYIDYDPYVREDIHTIKDLYNAIKNDELDLDTFKTYDLREFKNLQLPGEQDPAKRFGSHPIVNDKVNQVNEMNEIYKGLFSNTFVYSAELNEDGERNKIGSIYRVEDGKDEENNIKYKYYFYKLDETFNIPEEEFNVVMKENVAIFGYDFSLEKTITMSIVEEENCLVHYAKDGDEKIDWTNFYKKDSVFRDYHDIHIELKKE